MLAVSRLATYYTVCGNRSCLWVCYCNNPIGLHWTTLIGSDKNYLELVRFGEVAKKL